MIGPRVVVDVDHVKEGDSVGVTVRVSTRLVVEVMKQRTR